MQSTSAHKKILPQEYEACSKACHQVDRILCMSHTLHNTGELEVLCNTKSSAFLQFSCGSEGTQSRGWNGHCGMALFHPI